MHALLSLLVVSTGATVGILSTWAGSSRWHWVVRTFVVGVPLGSLLLVPAYEPFVALAVEAIVISGGLVAVRWIRRRIPHNPRATKVDVSAVQFSLKSVLGFMLIIGVVAAVIVRLPRLSLVAWLNTLHIGLALGVAVLLGVWVVRGRMQKRNRMLLALTAAVLLAVPSVATDHLLDSFSFGGEPWPPPGPAGVAPPYSGNLSWLWLALLPGVTLATALWCILALRSRTPHMPGRQDAPACVLLSTVAAIVWSGFLVLLPAYVLYRMLTPTPFPVRDYPSPNGWDLLAVATRILQSPIPEGVGDARFTELKTGVAAKQGGYDQFREALAHASLAPFSYQDEFFGGRRLTELQDFRGLARAVIAEGRSAEFEQRPDNAAKIYADTIELSQRISSGGVLIHALVGGAVQNLGNSALARIHRRLPGATAGQIARRLWKIEADREPFGALLANDRIWMQHALGWHGRTRLALADLAGEELELHVLVHRAYLRAITLTRLLIAELAIAAYTADHGEPPVDLAMMTPGILPAEVIDPFSQQPLCYRREGKEWLVYSVGYDGRDEDGRPPSDDDYLGWESGDMSLDSWLAWKERQ